MYKNTPTPEKTKLQIIKLYNSGKSLKKVADELNIHKSSVHRIVKKAGIVRTISQGSKLRPKWSEEHKQKISQSMKGRPSPWSTKPLKENYQTITPSLAYIVGVSMYDASIQKYSIKLESKDRDFVEEFYKQLLLHFGRCSGVRDGKKEGIFPSYREYREYKRSPTVVVSLNSKEASSFIDSCRNAKWVESLSTTNKIHWLRGAWDSEGTISKRKDIFFFTLQFVNSLKWKIDLYRAILYDITGNSYSVSKNKQGMYKVYTYNKEWIVQFYHLISPIIKRKRKIFQRLII